jgi:putative transposase
VDRGSFGSSIGYGERRCSILAKCDRGFQLAKSLLPHAMIHPANIQDRDVGILLMSTLSGCIPSWRSSLLTVAIKEQSSAIGSRTLLPGLKIEIVKRPDHVKGFVVLPGRWIVERTIAWLNRCRRLAKDWENLNRKALAFLRLASIRLMLRKLCNPT